MPVRRLVPAVAVLFGAAPLTRATPTLTTLLGLGGTTGYTPLSTPVVDPAGNVYLTTTSGGPGGYGAVVELSGADHRTVTTLVAFNGSNGATPYAGLVADPAGNLYGTAFGGGSSGSNGSVFELSGTNHQTFTTLATFNASGSAGFGPYGTLSVDPAGNLYGTNQYGGTGQGGTVFELSGADHRTLTTLASFTPSTGNQPLAGVTIDAAGNLYGTTSQQGPSGGGTAYELSGPTRQTFTTLVAFNSQTATGYRPYGTLAIDPAGNVYGTTSGGGGANTGGTVFELSGVNHQTFSVVVPFNTSAGFTGSGPLSGVTVDAAGDLFGTAFYGGPGGSGEAYELSGPNHRTVTNLVTFAGPPDAASPWGGLAPDAAGNLYGTSYYGGTAFGGVGTVYELSGTGFVPVPEPIAPAVLGATAVGLLARRRPSPLPAAG